MADITINSTALFDTRDNALVTGGRASRMYTQKMFEDDVFGGHCGFQIKYKGTNLVPLTWKNLMASPLSTILFGPPLSSLRSFDSTYIQGRKKHQCPPPQVHVLLLPLFGETNACMSLLNAYLSRCLYLLELKYTKEVAKVRSANGGIFKTKSAQDFLKKVNS